MHAHRRKVALAVATASVAALGTAMVSLPATAADGGPAVNDVDVRATGLNGPYGVMSTRQRGFVVAESAAGQVTRVLSNGTKKVVFDGVPGVAAAVAGGGHTFGVLGGPPPPEDSKSAQKRVTPDVRSSAKRAYPYTSLLRSRKHGGPPQVIANLEKYELKHNPDGQVQFVDGKPVDTLSNPFAMNYSKFGLLIADGGANDVLRVNPRTGKVSTFFVAPNVTDVPACQGPDANGNPGAVGCDAVPTGVDVIDNSVYVSTLGAERPGAGRVYKLSGRTGKVLRVWKNLDAPTGVAVSPQRDVFVSQVLANFPEEGPGPGFDPSTVGQITKISHGKRTVAAVTMPTGLDYRHGELYASTWSLAPDLGISDAGQIVKVHQRAFKPVAPAPPMS